MSVIAVDRIIPRFSDGVRVGPVRAATNPTDIASKRYVDDTAGSGLDTTTGDVTIAGTLTAASARVTEETSLSWACTGYDSIDATYTIEPQQDLTGIPIGSVVMEDHRIYLGSGGGVTWPIYTRNFRDNESYAFRVKFTPSAAFTGEMTLLLVDMGAVETNFTLQYAGAAGFIINVGLSDGIAMPWTHVAGVEYELDVEVDYGADLVYIYVNGVLLSSVSPGMPTSFVPPNPGSISIATGGDRSCRVRDLAFYSPALRGVAATSYPRGYSALRGVQLPPNDSHATMQYCYSVTGTYAVTGHYVGSIRMHAQRIDDLITIAWQEQLITNQSTKADATITVGQLPREFWPAVVVQSPCYVANGVPIGTATLTAGNVKVSALGILTFCVGQSSGTFTEVTVAETGIYGGSCQYVARTPSNPPPT